jgi:hypothetical protein
MGSIGTRITRLEGHSREPAVDELRRAWASLSDKEIAFMLGRYVELEMRSEGSLEEQRAVEKGRSALSAELIAQAIGFTEKLSPKEVDQRIEALGQRLGVLERGPGIRRYWQVTGGGAEE